MDLSQAAPEDSNSHCPSRASHSALNLAAHKEDNDETFLESLDEISENRSFESPRDEFHPPNNNSVGSFLKDSSSQPSLLLSTSSEDMDTSNIGDGPEEEYAEESDVNEEVDEDEGAVEEEEEGDEVGGEGEEEEDIGSEEEEEEYDEDPDAVNNAQESLKSDTIVEQGHVPSKESEPRRALLSLYSGMNDIISESSSISSSPASTPSVTPTKTLGNGPSRLQAALTSSLSYKGSGGGLLVHHPVTPKKRVVNKTNTDHLSEELNLGYRILMELMSDYQKGSNAPFMEPIELDPEKNGDYLEVVKKPIWLKKIREQLLDGKYSTITELIGDIRTMLENAYRYHGPAHSVTKKGLRLEHMMEQKIALLPKEVRELCTLEKTSGMPPEDITQKHRNKTARISVNGDNFFSYVLYRVRGCRVNRDKEMKKRRMEAMRQAKRDREQEVIHWEEDLLKEPIHTHMKAMWELPQIGHFIYLTLKTLNIYEVPQFELERTLLMPQASRTLAMLLTSLLSSPQQRQKLSEKPYMPYKVWARKLAHKTLLWYRCYSRENQDPQKVFDQMGIEPEFWQICGPSNPFERQLFHEMTFHQRVWLLKSLCDYLLHNHKTVQEVMAEQPEPDQREYNLGRDRNGNEYLHFPQFCGQSLRIYRRARVPSPEISRHEEEVVEGSILPLEKIKEFRKMIKRCRHKYEEEAEWEGSKKKKKKRRRANRVVDPEGELPSTIRSRPGHLRQRPRARYNDQYEDLGLSSDDEPKFKPKSKKARIEDTHSEDEDVDESVKESESLDTPPPEPNDVEDDATNSSIQSAPQEGLARSQQKNPRVRKGGKKKPTCELCGKSFHTIAALKGHRAVHTKEKQKLASEAESNPPLDKQTKLEDGLSETSEEKNDDSRDKFSNSENSIVQNGELESSDKLKNNIIDKLKDLKSESLVNGEVQDIITKADVVDEEKEDSESKSSSEVGVDIKLESTDVKPSIDNLLNNLVKNEKVDVKKEVDIKEEQDKIDIKEEQDSENLTDYVKVKEEDVESNVDSEAKRTNFDLDNNQRTENDEIPRSPSCDNDKLKSKSDAMANSKSSSPSPPAEPKPIHDPSPYLPRIEDFELVVTSVEQLRQLILKFGDLPEGGSNAANEKKENSKEEETKPEKRPSCEVKLHRALCNLLTELSPWETKLLSANKKLRTKLRNEWNDFVKRGADYVDPAEEAWMSDPEPEPEPPTATPQESSSSSSSSEESVDEDGNPKRKLRKRRAKRQAVAQMMENLPPPVEVPSVPTTQANPDSYAVSSRGRVRKVKKIINYDGLDFEKLAMQASLEAEEERVRKKRKREEEEREREEKERERSNVSSGGVQRYLLSQTGRVSGYIDNEGQVHSTSAMKDQRGKVDISSVRNLASQLVTSAKKESPKPQPRQHVGIPSRLFQNSNVKPDVPSIVVAAYDNQGAPVYVRVVGEQALQLVKYMRPGAKGPVSQIKLQHHGQTYTVNTNAQIMTKNIPGIPNQEKVLSPNPSFNRTTAPTSASASTPAGNKPTAVGGLATSSSPALPRVAPITTVVNTASNPPNTLALAYRGLARPARPVTVSSGIARPQGTVVRGVIHQDHTRPSTAPTRLVTASPSVVSSVMSPSSRPSSNVTSPINVYHQVNRQPAPTVMTSTVRPPGAQVVNRVAGVPTAGHVATTVTSPVPQLATPVVHHNTDSQQVAVQSTSTQAVSVISQPQGQAVTAATVVVPASGGQPQLRLESESLAQLMQRTGSKIIAVPNGKGGYTLSLTPGAVSPGQKNQTHIAANTAAKVQVVTSASAALLQECSPASPVQQQVIQQQTVSPPGGARSATVVQGIQGIGRPAGVTQQTVSPQQVGLRQVIPVTTAPGTVIKTNNVVTQGTQLVLNSGQQNFTRVAAQPRVYTNLVTAQTSPQASRTSTVSAATVLASQQTVNTIVNANQQTALVQNAVGHKGVTVQAQASSVQATPVQQQYVVQQRVIAQPAGTQHQVVRLQQANPSQSGTAGQRLTVQIVQQPGGGQQVVQMMPQVVSQASVTANQQGLIYVQGPGQVITQQKTSLATVQQSQLQSPSHHQLQIQSPQQQQQHVVTQAPIVAQQQVGQVTQQHVGQTAQQQVAQVTQQAGQTAQQQVGQVSQVAHVVQPQQQQTHGRLVIVRTNQGEQMALHHPDGRLTFLTQEQLQAAIRNSAVQTLPATT